MQKYIDDQVKIAVVSGINMCYLSLRMEHLWVPLVLHNWMLNYYICIYIFLLHMYKQIAK